MKTNVNLFIALVLCAVMGGLLYFLVRPAQDDLGWNPNEMYGELGARSYDGSSFTNATLSGASNGGVALSMPHTSFSLRTRVPPTTYSPLPISNSQSPIANGPSPIAYMTSGAEYRSFGGGGNGNMGAAGTFRASAQSPIANSQSPIAYSQSPIAYTPSPIANGPSPISNSPSPISNTPATVASGSNPAGLFSYALQTSYGTASYEDMYGSASNRRINGAMRLPGSGGNPDGVGGNGDDVDGFGDTWLIWLREYLRSTGKGHGDECGLDYYELEDLYNQWLAEWSKANMGKNPPLFWNFFDWFYNNAQANGGSLNLGWIDSETGEDQWMTVNWVPVGNILPLVLLAMSYMVYMYIRRRKHLNAE